MRIRVLTVMLLASLGVLHTSMLAIAALSPSCPANGLAQSWAHNWLIS